MATNPAAPINPTTPINPQDHITLAKIFNLLVMCRVNGAANLAEQYVMDQDAVFERADHKQTKQSLRHFQNFALRMFCLRRPEAPEFTDKLVDNITPRSYITRVVNAIGQRVLTADCLHFYTQGQVSGHLFVTDVNDTIDYRSIVDMLLEKYEDADVLPQLEVVPGATALSRRCNIIKFKLIYL